jgi:hypothetical protein
LSNTFMAEQRLSHPEEVNEAYTNDKNSAAFNGVDPYGNEPQQGPLWIRPGTLLSDALDGYSQVVGHTIFPAIQTIRVNEDDSRDPRTITFIDTGERRSVYRWSA